VKNLSERIATPSVFNHNLTQYITSDLLTSLIPPVIGTAEKSILNQYVLILVHGTSMRSKYAKWEVMVLRESTCVWLASIFETTW
jgi:hypothetical protein